MTETTDTEMDAESSGRTIETPTIAVTGAAGYIGSRVVVEFQEAYPDWEIIAIDNQYRGQVDSIGDIDIEHVDIRNRDRLEDALAGANVVCHLAAISGVDDCEENQDLAYEVNVTGTNNVAWFCRKTGAALAFPFSMAVLGDPEEFPITADQPRDPLNWYGRTKLLGERAIETFAGRAFPAHLFLKSNLYGEHEVDGTTVGKPTVINFFVNRALAGETLTVYEPGTQARNFVHVKDVARVYVRSAERLLEQLERRETGTETFEVASGEDMSVMEVAEIVREVAREERGIEVDVELVENPRSAETMVEEFGVDISAAHETLGWNPRESVGGAVRRLLRREA
ncbi:NAD(P)-dependent oxidoreductase [Halorubrum ezzemoulense]|uniref:NAD(P)-dependent oxidoreductase n=1 Tax=Halorubrum ezzemoulense TaxID=337243 RepID=A0ABT4Z030_HALEZ|nr:NAD(P)-dependent oxidoreductase [Halorubrum ezzemoulense]MDB2245704.1 NAD(P)-dependent oxidoreductase [Halorubrum ezzemoulense]MDB2278918.1 NAD(P)-dependent oxidoreductase [Halorubrum ezzemoulense]MDB2287660.1 NAD(P)-dependent oxidoreductase [Halorubrum ezzemoulense]MDB2291108.1 NAD(P)-dependent oxidoreductase [Halorubrum ezzemoulense]MDB2295552.1 NAD(P)-dependent oxidoreductase [Halorubrum ezzemoulense]